MKTLLQWLCIATAIGALDGGGALTSATRDGGDDHSKHIIVGV